MNSLTAQMLAFRSQAQTFAEAVLPARIQIAGRVYEASTGGVRNLQKLATDGGGFVDVTVVSFRLRKSLCPSRPLENSLLVWIDENRPLRVKQVANGGITDPNWLITCEAPTE